MDQDQYDALLISSEASKAKDSLMTFLGQTEIFDMCYAYKARVKPKGKLIEKKGIKLPKKPWYQVTSITDVVGLRLVTLFRHEMPKVFLGIFDIMNHKVDFSPNYFRVNSIEEIIVYKTGPYDEIAIEIEEIVVRTGLKEIYKEELSKQGYSSIHIVTRLASKIDELSKESGIYYIPVELQIRTVFEDAWGEIDHKYGYVIREGKSTDAQISNPASVLKHLTVLKKFADACGEYSDAIHFEAFPSLPPKTAQDEKVISVVSDMEILKLFSELGVSQDDIDDYVVSRESRKVAEASRKFDYLVDLSVFVDIAESFRVLAEKYEKEAKSFPGRKSRLFYYYCKMNEAICLLNTNHDDLIKFALRIYNDLEKFYKEFPLLKMRIAQSLGKLGDTEGALVNFEETYKYVSNFQINGKQFCDELPEVDYLHIKRYLPYLYGYQMWKKACSLPDNSKDEAIKKLALLEKSYLLTGEISGNLLENDKPFLVDNNLLYYALQIKEISNKWGMDTQYQHVVDRIRQHLLDFETQINLEEESDLELLDTLAYAYEAINDKDRHVAVLVRIIEAAKSQCEFSSFSNDMLCEISNSANLKIENYAKNCTVGP